MNEPRKWIPKTPPKTLLGLERPKFKNPVALTVWELGGQKNVSTLISRKGVVLNRQTIYHWCSSGSIPSKYRNALMRIVHDHPDMVTNIQGFLECIRPEGEPNNSSVFPNEPLANWVDSQGGITSLVKRMNVMIAASNEEIKRYKNSAMTPDKKWTYVMVHNWLKRGRVSDDFRSTLELMFGCPREIMGPEQKPKDFRRELTPADILG